MGEIPILKRHNAQQSQLEKVEVEATPTPEVAPFDPAAYVEELSAYLFLERDPVPMSKVETVHPLPRGAEDLTLKQFVRKQNEFQLITVQGQVSPTHRNTSGNKLRPGSRLPSNTGRVRAKSSSAGRGTSGARCSMRRRRQTTIAPCPSGPRLASYSPPPNQRETTSSSTPMSPSVGSPSVFRGRGSRTPPTSSSKTV